MQVSEAELQRAKDAMAAKFEAHRVRPGSTDFQYDVQRDFKPAPDAENEWDEDEDAEPKCASDSRSLHFVHNFVVCTIMGPYEAIGAYCFLAL